MFHSTKTPLLLLLVSLLTACGGPRINSKPETLKDYGPMLLEGDTHLVAKLDQLMFRNSRGSWAKDANWDEYLITLESRLAGQVITIEQIWIEDVMGDLHPPQTTRKDLNKATRGLKKKYKKAGYKIKLGAGSTHATAVGLSFAIGSGATAGAVTATGAIGNLTSAGVGAAVAVPALMIAGVTKVVYNTRVNNRIQERQTLLPKTLGETAESLDLLYPAVPIPQALVIEYRVADVPHRLQLDLTQITGDLHIKPPKK